MQYFTMGTKIEIRLICHALFLKPLDVRATRQHIHTYKNHNSTYKICISILVIYMLISILGKVFSFLESCLTIACSLKNGIVKFGM